MQAAASAHGKAASSTSCVSPGALVVEAAEDGAPLQQQPHGAQMTAGAREAYRRHPRDLAPRVRAPAQQLLHDPGVAGRRRRAKRVVEQRRVVDACCASVTPPRGAR